MIAFVAGIACGLVAVWPGRATVPAPPLPRAVVRAAVQTPPAPPIEAEGGIYSPHPERNLFAFVELPQPRTLQAEVAPRVAVVAPQPVVLVAPEPPRPAFTFRYIGTFGPSANPFAVFARDGEVINVRAGEAIGDGFVLRRIGVESADVAQDGYELRVPLTAR